jgi:coenzyme PQQ biosynthesis protein PqqD
MIEPQSRLRRRDRVITQHAAEQWILLDVESGQYYALDEVSGRVWDLCDGTRDVSTMVAEICRDYDAPAETVEEDVLSFLNEMMDERLVIPEPAMEGIS